jgi:hypothetical protein
LEVFSCPKLIAWHPNTVIRTANTSTVHNTTHQRMTRHSRTTDILAWLCWNEFELMDFICTLLFKEEFRTQKT